VAVRFPKAGLDVELTGTSTTAARALCTSRTTSSRSAPASTSSGRPVSASASRLTWGEHTRVYADGKMILDIPYKGTIDASLEGAQIVLGGGTIWLSRASR